ncbi:MAG: ATP-binding protein [Verrucomicrobia bacterium]|nr:ATP-binding protein [Verrucomicrobiota bacterium]
MSSEFLFSQMTLPPELVEDLRRQNPWWEGRALPVLPPHRRHLVRQIHRRLEWQLAPVVVVRGPRQIGKTTAQEHVIQDLFEAGVEGQRVLRVQFDDLSEVREFGSPILRMADWFERTILKRTLNEAARAGQPAFLFLDEVQNLDNWAPQLKSLVDSSTVQVVVTGSSALRIEAGRDSLAGRITSLEAGTLSLTEIAMLRGMDLGEPYLQDNGLEALTQAAFWTGLREHGQLRKETRDTAFAAFSERGGYPLAHLRAAAPWEQVADQLNETVIKRVIQHDLRIGERGRKRDPALLEELFRLCCRYAGQTPTIQTLAREAQRILQANVGAQRINAYLRFLGDTLLLRLIPPLEIRLKRKRGSPKLCLVDHGLRASWLQEQIPLDPRRLREEPELTVVAGHLAESVTGAVLSTITGLDIAHFPERHGEPEVDFVLTIGIKRIPVEVKYQAKIDPLRDTEGLRAFIERAVNNAPFGILITQDDSPGLVDPRLVTLPLSSLMLLR